MKTNEQMKSEFGVSYEDIVEKIKKRVCNADEYEIKVANNSVEITPIGIDKTIYCLGWFIDIARENGCGCYVTNAASFKLVLYGK